MACSLSIMEKKWKRVCGGCDLGMISGGFQFATALFEGRSNLGRLARCLGVERRCKVLQLRIQRVKENQAITLEQGCHHAGKCLGVRATGSPRTTNQSQHVGRKFGFWQQLEQSIHNSIDRLIYRNTPASLSFTIQRGLSFNACTPAY